MGGLLSRLFGRRFEERPAGLADPDHPSAKWIRLATLAADRRLTVELVEGRIAVEAEPGALDDVLGSLDLALEVVPNDADLWVARATVNQLLRSAPEVRNDLEKALKLAPGHPEASAMLRYEGRWNNLLFLPPWSPEQRWAHPVLAERTNEGDVLHAVRYRLQPALLVMMVSDEAASFGNVTGHCWKVVCSETPHGPLGAHYAVLELGAGVRRQESFLAPPTPPPDPGDVPPQLVTRLPGMRTCFLVVVSPSGEVVLNLPYDLPRDTRSTLSELSERLVAGAAGASPTSVRASMEWHTQHVALESIGRC